MNRDVIGERLVNLMPLWDGSGWRVWIPGPDGLLEMRPLDAVHADYVAKQPAKESDLWIRFVDFMWQRASWPEVCPQIHAICNEFHNLSTSVAKLRHFHRTRGMAAPGVPSAFAATEVEYLATVAYGVFDLLQETIAEIWQGRIRLLDEDAERRRKGRRLPSSFSKVVLKNKQGLKSPEDIGHEYGLPAGLASAYSRQSPFFAALRDVRHKAVHGLGSMPMILVTDQGFCVDPLAEPFRRFDVWTDEHRYTHNKALVSLLPWLSHVILNTVEACSTLMDAFASQIRFPDEIAPGYRVFVRGINSGVVLDLLKCRRGELVWWEDDKPEVQLASAPADVR